MSERRQEQQEAAVFEARRHALQGDLVQAQQCLDRAEQFGAVTSSLIERAQKLVPALQAVS